MTTTGQSDVVDGSDVEGATCEGRRRRKDGGRAPIGSDGEGKKKARETSENVRVNGKILIRELVHGATIRRILSPNCPKAI